MIEPLQLQRLVDGELSSTERLEMLHKLDASPAAWRQVALAMLEEQDFVKQFGSRSHPPVREHQPIVHAVNQPFISEVQSSTPTPTGKRRIPSIWVPALAASVLMLFGFSAGRFWNGGVSPTGEGRDIAANRPSMDMDTYEKSLPYADLRVPASDRDIPIYNANEIDPTYVLARQAKEVELINNRLRQSGYEIDMRQQYMTGQLRDGRQVVVPIQQVGLKPVGQ
jgi:hypothetical protein